MKTREEFVLLADAFRREAQWRAWLFFAALLLAFIISAAGSGVADYLLGLHQAGGWILIVLFLAMTAFLCFYKIKSMKSLAWKFELACPTCSRPVMPDDLKLTISTHNCPHCGSLLFS